VNAFPRLFVWFNAILFASVGVGFLVAPEFFGAWVELELSSDTARTDVRAVYGGLDLGMGLFLLWCGADPERTRAGIAAATLGVVGLAFGRTLGSAIDGLSAANALFLAIELTCAAGGLVAWRLHRTPHVT